MRNRDRIQRLLDKLCVELGFCLPPAEQEAMGAAPLNEVRAFVDRVFRAEGLDPETADRQLYRQVHDRVADMFDSMLDEDEP